MARRKNTAEAYEILLRIAEKRQAAARQAEQLSQQDAEQQAAEQQDVASSNNEHAPGSVSGAENPLAASQTGGRSKQVRSKQVRSKQVRSKQGGPSQGGDGEPPHVQRGAARDSKSLWSPRRSSGSASHWLEGSSHSAAQGSGQRNLRGQATVGQERVGQERIAHEQRGHGGLRAAARSPLAPRRTRPRSAVQRPALDEQLGGRDIDAVGEYGASGSDETISRSRWQRPALPVSRSPAMPPVQMPSVQMPPAQTPLSQAASEESGAIPEPLEVEVCGGEPKRGIEMAAAVPAGIRAGAAGFSSPVARLAHGEVFADSLGGPLLPAEPPDDVPPDDESFGSSGDAGDERDSDSSLPAGGKGQLFTGQPFTGQPSEDQSSKGEAASFPPQPGQDHGTADSREITSSTQSGPRLRWIAALERVRPWLLAPGRIGAWLVGESTARGLSKAVELRVSTLIMGTLSLIIVLSLVGISINLSLRSDRSPPAFGDDRARAAFDNWDTSAPRNASQLPQPLVAEARRVPGAIEKEMWKVPANAAIGSEFRAVKNSPESPSSSFEAPAFNARNWWICLRGKMDDKERENLLEHLESQIFPHLNLMKSRSRSETSLAHKEAFAVPMSAHPGLFLVYAGPFEKRADALEAVLELQRELVSYSRLRFKNYFGDAFPYLENETISRHRRAAYLETASR